MAQGLCVATAHGFPRKLPLYAPVSPVPPEQLCATIMSPWPCTSSLPPLIILDLVLILLYFSSAWEVRHSRCQFELNFFLFFCKAAINCL